MAVKKSSVYQRRLNVAKQKKRAAAGKKAAQKLKGRKQSRGVRNKLKLYRGLVNDYVKKQKEIGGDNTTFKKASQSAEMKQIVKDLKSRDPFIKLSALKKTTRRDGIPDTIMVGESPSMDSAA